MSERELGRRVPTQEDFDLFARISGDDNPIHVDPDFSERTRFGRTVAHGMLLYSWAWALLRSHFPDRHFAHAQLMFPHPCFAGEEITFMLAGVTHGNVHVSVRRVQDNAEVLSLLTESEERSHD